VGSNRIVTDLIVHTHLPDATALSMLRAEQQYASLLRLPAEQDPAFAEAAAQAAA